MTGVAEEKAAARKAAFERRKAAQEAGRDAEAQSRLHRWLTPYAGRALSGYMPIRTEIDPRPVMADWTGPVCVPVILEPGQPLAFHRWRPGCDLVEGPFGALVPAVADPVVPEILIVPLLAFDRSGHRLGYGGGFYDRTLAALRHAGPVIAIGFAYAAQEAAALPREETDVRLDAIVTDAELLEF